MAATGLTCPIAPSRAVVTVQHCPIVPARVVAIGPRCPIVQAVAAIARRYPIAPVVEIGRHFLTVLVVVEIVPACPIVLVAAVIVRACRTVLGCPTAPVEVATDRDVLTDLGFQIAPDFRIVPSLDQADQTGPTGRVGQTDLVAAEIAPDVRTVQDFQIALGVPIDRCFPTGPAFLTAPSWDRADPVGHQIGRTDQTVRTGPIAPCIPAGDGVGILGGTRAGIVLGTTTPGITGPGIRIGAIPGIDPRRHSLSAGDWARGTIAWCIPIPM